MDEVLVKEHPTLGVLVRSDGAVLNHLGGGSTKTRWTYGGSRKDGYKRVTINKKEHVVHRLVAETFLERIPGKDYVDHINRLRDDNRVENLRWVTAFENNENGRAADRADYGVRAFEDQKAYDAARYQALKQDPVKLEHVKAKHKEWVEANRAHLAEYARRRRAERRMKLLETES